MRAYAGCMRQQTPPFAPAAPCDATNLLAEPLASSSEPRFRAEVLRLQARIDYLAARPERTSMLLLEASQLLEHEHPKLAVEIAAEACATLQILGDAPRLLGTARHAQSLAVELGDDEVSRLALFTLGWALCYAGHPEEGVPLVKETAGAVEHGSDGLDPLEILRGSLALDWLDRSCRAFTVAGRAVDETRARGAVGLVPYVVLQQAWHAVRAGLLEEGYAGASEALGLARELELQLPRMQALLTLTAVTARRGAEEECRAYADEVAALAEGAGIRVFRIWRLYSLGALSLGLGRFDEAARDFEACAQGLDELGLHSPSFVPRAELVEVHVRAGRPEQAAAALYRYSASPEAQSPLGQAAAARGRGLLASNEDFEAYFDEALAANELSDDRWSLARTHLCVGERLRRSGRRVDAREQLRLALSAFEEMRAEVWVARAHAELRASGEALRRRKDVAGRAADAAGAPDRAPRRARADEPRGRRCALPLAQDGRVPPEPDLPQARHDLAIRADREVRQRCPRRRAGTGLGQARGLPSEAPSSTLPRLLEAVGRDRVGRIRDGGVVPRAAADLVGSRAADDDVVPGFAVQHVVGVAADQDVVAFAAVGGVADRGGGETGGDRHVIARESLDQQPVIRRLGVLDPDQRGQVRQPWPGRSVPG